MLLKKKSTLERNTFLVMLWCNSMIQDYHIASIKDCNTRNMYVRDIGGRLWQKWTCRKVVCCTCMKRKVCKGFGDLHIHVRDGVALISKVETDRVELKRF